MISLSLNTADTLSKELVVKLANSIMMTVKKAKNEKELQYPLAMTHVKSLTKANCHLLYVKLQSS